MADRGRGREREEGAREGETARATSNVVSLRGQEPPSKDWLRRTFRAFKISYPKGVPEEVKHIWAAHCYDEASREQVMAGLAAWKLSRQWLEDGPDFATKPYDFLNDRYYEFPPLPWRADIPAAPEPDAVGVERREFPQPPERRENETATAETRRRLSSLLTPLPEGTDRVLPPEPPALEARYTVRRAAGAPGGGP